MHELAIAEYVLRTAVPAAEKAGASRILEIRMKIGELSGVLPWYLENCMEIAAKGTIADGAKLVVTPLPIRIRCRRCGGEAPADRKHFFCPSCGSGDVAIIGGREYFLEDLLVE